MLYLLVILPLLSVLLLNLPFKKETGNRLAFWWALALCAAETFWVLCPAWNQMIVRGQALTEFFGWAPVGNNLSRVMFLVIGGLGAVSLMIGRYREKDPNKLFLFANLVVLAVGGMNGVVLARDLFSLYVFLEVTVVAATILIASDRDLIGFEGAFKYQIVSFVATAMLLAAVGLFLLMGGGVGFADIAAAVSSHPQNPIVLLALALVICGLLLKGGLAPFHGWVPDAYVAAPPGVGVLFAGILTKTTGAYALIRVVSEVVGASESVRSVLLVCGLLSIVLGALAALPQSDMRRMFAYSSISQIGYIVLGLGAGTALGIVGAIFHLFNHAIFSGLLFVNAAAVEQETGIRDMRLLGGLGSRMPVTGASSVAAMLSGAGVPPFAGFWSKLMIVIAVWQSGHEAFAIIAILFSVVTLAYFLALQRQAYFGQPARSLAQVKEAGLWACAPAIVLALTALLVGLAFPWLFGTFLVPIGSFL